MRKLVADFMRDELGVTAIEYGLIAALIAQGLSPFDGAQLGVYLRLNGVPVPAIYGPSADEPWA